MSYFVYLLAIKRNGTLYCRHHRTRKTDQRLEQGVEAAID